MQVGHDISLLFVELGAAIFGLAILARLASRLAISAIPLYLIGGLCFGNGGLVPLGFSQGFIHVGGEIGVLLLLFMLGLEYSGQELSRNLRVGIPAATADFLLNFSPGVIAGLLLGWTLLASILLGGVTWISSSGIIAKVLSDLRRMNSPETGTVLSILVLEDLAMAIYLPLLAALLVGGSVTKIAVSVAIALCVVFMVLLAALRFGAVISGWFRHDSDEVVLLTTLGVVLLVAGWAQRAQVSSAVGAFLVGVAFSGPVAEQSHRLMAPLRDLFAATFFLFFGLQIDPRTLPPVLLIAIALGVLTGLTKTLTGYWAAKRAGIDGSLRWRAGLALIPRGEFSIVIAALGGGLQPALEPLSAAYVLFLAIAGPIAARLAK
jgi:CPA2 family monovalent cation:H+ antiporter-2